jgi:hypothetical protein
MAAHQGVNGLLAAASAEAAVGSADEGTGLMAGGVTGFTFGKHKVASAQGSRLSAEALLEPILSELAGLRSLLIEASRSTNVQPPVCCSCTRHTSASDAITNASTAPDRAIAVEKDISITEKMSARQEMGPESDVAISSDAVAMISQDAQSSYNGANTVAFELSETPRARLQHQQDTLLALTPLSSTVLTPAGAVCSPRDIVFMPPAASPLQIAKGYGRKKSADSNGLPSQTQPNSIVPLPIHPQQLMTISQSWDVTGVKKTPTLVWNPRRRSLIVLRKAFNAIRCESLRSALSCDAGRMHNGCDSSWTVWTPARGYDQGSVDGADNMANNSCHASPALGHIESPWLPPRQSEPIEVTPSGGLGCS